MLKPKLYTVMAFITVLVVIFAACTSEAPSTPPTPETERENMAIITDRTGREWDVTHARDEYDMDSRYYNYGIGIGAIPSVDHTRVITEGEPGYPSPDDSRRVFGVNHNGEQRAYSVSELSRHEVFNDAYPGESEQYVAVTY